MGKELRRLAAVLSVFLLLVSFLVGEAKSGTLSGLFKENATFNGYLENESALRLNSPREFSKVQNLFQLETTYNYSSDLKIYGLTWFLYDAAYRLTDRYSNEAVDAYEDNLRTKEIVRELYIEGAVGDLSFRLGKQQVIWGEAVGLRITDVINPQDFREFILDNFIDSRIPLWMLRINYFVGDWEIESVLIPDFEPDRPAITGSEWAVSLPSPLPVAPTLKPDDDVEDLEIGVRLLRFIGGWDLSVSYFYTWDDAPAFHIRESATGRKVFPEHHRIHIIGFGFNNAFGRWVPRGEFGLHLNKFFRILESEVQEGVVKRDRLFYMVGTDYTVSDNLLINAQFIQQIIFNHRHGMADDEIQNIFSLLFLANFLNETLNPEFLIIYDANEGDLWMRPKVVYDLNDQVKLTLGLDVLEGGPIGILGQFDDNDRIFSEVKYSF